MFSKSTGYIMILFTLIAILFISLFFKELNGNEQVFHSEQKDQFFEEVTIPNLPEPSPDVTEFVQMRIMVVGDVLMHIPLTKAGYNRQTDQYQFESFFQQVKPIFAKADFVIGNLETPLAGKEKGFSGYPRFNAPKEIALALKNAGVNVLTTANNHSFDQGEQGLIKTLDHLDEYQILHTGSFRTQSERDIPLILEKDGFKIGLIAYTYGLNGFIKPKDKPYLVNTLDLEAVASDVKRLKENHVDYILAMIHYGTEYQRVPNDLQKKWTEDLMANGVDFVLGSHPHVVQPLQVIKGDNRQSDRGVVYSLGNFLSNQQGDWKDYGIILDLLLEKNRSNQKITLKEINAIPTYVKNVWEKGKKIVEIIPIVQGNKNIQKQIVNRGNELVQHVMIDQ